MDVKDTVKRTNKCSQSPEKERMGQNKYFKM